MKLLNNRVLVKPDEVIKQTKSGIILSDSTVEKPTTGTVVIGNEEVKKDSRILFSKFGYDEVIIDEEKLYVISSPNILAIL